ncbi:Nucleoporin nup84 [Teratosphaeriaceae sp. CCFEE 6253]|nr:Nucleoporin nup84 [Teratosphaeriaceae sp. CCFEE 6253]
MPPTTRRAQSGSGMIKKVTRKTRPPAVRNPSSSWDFTDLNDDDDVRESVEDHAQEQQSQSDSSPEVEEVVKPLRDMADHVSRGVETFAINFDEFLSDVRKCEDEASKFDAARAIIASFRSVAEDAVSELQRTHQKERTEQLRKEWAQRAQLSTTGNLPSMSTASRGGIVSGMKAEKVDELRQWTQELDIWDLFATTVDFWYNRHARKQASEDKLATLQPPHRYTSERELWERFLLENETAKAHLLYREWLEQTADLQGTDLSSIMQELETRSGAGKGLWNRGWLNTRERIKGEKRVRSWPTPSDSVQPQIRTSAGSDMLVTTLDPDAPTRQGRTLEPQDTYFEHAMWITCWEMLRRGKSWTEILEWCEQHNEAFRAAILCPALDSSDALSNSAWRRMCYLASESGCSNDYEAAVYGLLGGNLGAVQKVCTTVDDHLFAHYTCSLVRQFDRYLQAYHPNRVSHRPAGVDDGLEDEEKAQAVISQFIKQLRNDKGTHDEAVSPLKIIESYLLANDAETLASMVGTAISDLDSLRGGSEETIVRTRHPPPIPQFPAEKSIVTDDRALRIVTHIYLVLTAIDTNPQPSESIAAEENLLVAYIQSLRMAGKRDFVPCYASRLHGARAIVTMSRTLLDVSQVKEQQQMLSLMEAFDIEPVEVLTELQRWTTAARASQGETAETPLRILEDCEVTQLHPGRRIINGFLEQRLSDDDMATVQTLSWFQLLPGHWQLTFASLAASLRTCLLTGRLACAVEIVHEFPCEVIAHQKSYSVLGRSANVMDKSLTPADQNSDEARQWEVLRQQARTYCDLEHLVHAIEALAHWVEHERPCTDPPKPGNAVPPAMRRAKIALTESMAPLLAGVLMHAKDEEEKDLLDQIRRMYLPEVLIAYNTALYTAGPTISRDSYIESMDLSVAIASSEANGLAETFVQAGRMRELVKGFAQASKMMLVMKANGRARKPDKKGKDLGIWEIGPQGSAAAEGVHVDVS